MPNKQLHLYLDSDWDFKPPVVRIWIDDFLITERAITPQKKFNEYLEEVVVINFKKGNHKIVVENIKTALADVELLKIIMDKVGDKTGKHSVECPITTKDGITYEANLKI